MPVTYAMTVKTARMTATRDSVANGTLELLSSGNTVLAIFGLSDSAGSVANDIWTLALDNTKVNGETAAAGGTKAEKARIKNSAGAVRVTGLTVGLTDSTADIKTINPWITAGLETTLSSAAIKHAPDPT